MIDALTWECWDGNAIVFDGEEVIVRETHKSDPRRAVAHVYDSETVCFHAVDKDEDGEDVELFPDWIARTGTNPRLTRDDVG